jgi:SPP1 family predicted phage head-tail adaptor
MGLTNIKDQTKRVDRVGRMDRRISFLKPIVADGDSNEDKITGWEKITTSPDVWAYKQDLKGREVVVADRVQFMYLTNWTIRYRTDLKGNYRLVHGTQVYEIITIAEGEGRGAYTDVVTNILENETWQA